MYQETEGNDIDDNGIDKTTLYENIFLHHLTYYR